MIHFLGRFSRALVALSLYRPRAVLVIALLMSVLGLGYVVGHFSVRTDLGALISRSLPWRKAEARMEQAFPSQGEDLAVLIAGPTPEQAEAAAHALDTALRKHPNTFASVRRPDGGDYFGRQALLFEDLPTVQKTTSRLIAAQPFIGPLVADPSLRGIAGAVNTAVAGAQGDNERANDLAAILDETYRVAERNMTGRPVALSWLQLVTGQAPDRVGALRIVQLTPKLDQRLVNPGAEPVKRVREAWAGQGAERSGSTIRLTGSVAMESDELKTLGELTGLIAIVSLSAMVLVLYLAVRSVSLVILIVATVALGLVTTTALGLVFFKHFSLISVAFLPLFAGLGIDFTVQFAMRARFEQGSDALTKSTLTAAGLKAGPGILLATASVAAGFFAFLPTSYRGVSELGLIAGVGMGVAAIGTLTIFPAAMALMAKRILPQPASLALGTQAALPRRPALRVGLLVLLALACGVSALNVPRLRFDFDPLSLRDPRTDSVSAFKDLSTNLDTTPNTIEILAPSGDAARTLARKLKTSSEVGRVITADDVVPPDQAAKLAAIADAKSILEFSLDPLDTPPAATDAETITALKRSAEALAMAAKEGGPAAASETRLGELFTRLASAPAMARVQVERGLTQAIPAAASQLRQVLDPFAVTLDTLPGDVRREWISPMGQWRLEVYPKTTRTDTQATAPFVRAVSSLAPTATGTPITVLQAGDTVLHAFIEAALLATVVITVLVGGVLRSLRGAILTIVPIILTLILTLGSCALVGLAINLENLIALPLLLGLAASFNIYTVVAWRDGASETVKRSLSRAIFFSGLTTATAFAALILSAHPGTASLGALLTISLFWTLTTALVILPALLSRFRPSSAKLG